MPPKRSSMKQRGSKDVTELKRTKADNPPSEPETNETPVGNEETKYFLQREKSLLLSRIKKTKKELSDLRASVKDLEFKGLQDPQSKEDKFPELKKNVEMWSKTMGMTLDKVVYANSETREWYIQGAVDGVQFSLNIFCVTNEMTKKGYVKNFLIECSEPCKHEFQPFLNNIDGNIEQILKLLKDYSEMKKVREVALKECTKEFPNVIGVSLEPSGETVVELDTDDVYYFQIRWKLSPSIMHFSKVKNVCRIACTKDGDQYIKKNTDLQSIQKRLGQSPIDVIKMLAKGIADQSKSKKDEMERGTEKGER